MKAPPLIGGLPSTAALRASTATEMKSSVGSGAAVGNDNITTRLSTLEALADRCLFTASAAYVYARRAALRGEGDVEKLDAALSEAVQSAYARQRALAGETL